MEFVKVEQVGFVVFIFFGFIVVEIRLFDDFVFVLYKGLNKLVIWLFVSFCFFMLELVFLIVCVKLNNLFIFDFGF